MLVLRLQRTGRKNRATFRVVLQEKTQAPKSKALEILGSYNPHLEKREDQIQLDGERITHWLSQGAQASNTVHNMLVEAGVIKADKKKSVAPKPKPKEEGEESAETPAAAPAEGDKPAEGGDDAQEEKAEEPKEDAPAEEEKKEE